MSVDRKLGGPEKLLFSDMEILLGDSGVWLPVEGVDDLTPLFVFNLSRGVNLKESLILSEVILYLLPSRLETVLFKQVWVSGRETWDMQIVHIIACHRVSIYL